MCKLSNKIKKMLELFLIPISRQMEKLDKAFHFQGGGHTNNLIFFVFAYNK